MVKYCFVLLFVLGITFVKGQTYAFIDSDYILKNVPEYISAKEKLVFSIILETVNDIKLGFSVQ